VEAGDGGAPDLLELQSDSTALVNVLLAGISEPTFQVLHLLWQQVPHLFRSQTFPTGVVRVNADGYTTLGKTFASLARSLGVARTMLFQGERGGPERHRVLLTEPTSLVVEGALPDSESPAYKYRLGEWLIGARPELLLVTALSTERLQLIIDSVLAGFGPPGRLSGDVAQVAQVAESLWEGLSPGAQRRLQELCTDPAVIRLDAVVAVARQGRARAGLFASGRLDCAISQISATLGEGQCVGPESGPDWLSEACAQVPEIADLVLFASSAVYAQARFRTAGEGERGRHPAELPS